eukprot:Sspe_Gene.118828::Locus_113229_Transcript_1_1_Confidence_1.000_Length_518::g.118828::m.118828
MFVPAPPCGASSARVQRPWRGERRGSEASDDVQQLIIGCLAEQAAAEEERHRGFLEEVERCERERAVHWLAAARLPSAESSLQAAEEDSRRAIANEEQCARMHGFLVVLRDVEEAYGSVVPRRLATYQRHLRLLRALERGESSGRQALE